MNDSSEKKILVISLFSRICHILNIFMKISEKVS